MNQSEILPLLEVFEKKAKDGVLHVPDHEGQIIVEEGSLADQKCREAQKTNHAMFIMEHEAKGKKYIQYVVSDDILS